MKQIQVEFNKISKLLVSVDSAIKEKENYSLYGKGVAKALAPYVKHIGLSSKFFKIDFDDIHKDKRISFSKMSMWLDMLEQDIESAKKTYKALVRIHKEIE